MDDNTNYLNPFINVINSVTVLGHGILKMEVVTSIYTAISLVGLHILKFFRNLILYKDSTLLYSFPKLFGELN